MSPILKSVEEAGIKGVHAKSRPHLIEPDHFFEDTDQLRIEYSKIIGSQEPLRSVVVPSVSYAIACAAKNLNVPTESNIITVDEQFPSHVYSWLKLAEEKKARVKVVSPPDQFEDRGMKWNERLLESIDLNTSAVAIPNVHWADGTSFDLTAIRKRTNEVGAALIIDGTQSVGALPINVSEVKPDLLVSAGYKWLMGPYSIGMAYFGEMFDEGSPIEENWINRLDSENFAGLVDYQDQYHPGALRYEVGEHSNFVLVPMLLEALKQINQWKVEQIQAYSAEIAEPAILRLQQMGYFIESREHRGSHLFGIRFSTQTDVEELRKELKENNVIVSVRGSSVRTSVNVFNTAEDIQKLTEILEHVHA